VFSEFLQPHLGRAGFCGHFTNKQGRVREGSALFWRASKWACAAVQDVKLRVSMLGYLARLPLFVWMRCAVGCAMFWQSSKHACQAVYDMKLRVSIFRFSLLGSLCLCGLHTEWVCCGLRNILEAQQVGLPSSVRHEAAGKQLDCLARLLDVLLFAPCVLEQQQVGLCGSAGHEAAGEPWGVG
jgi:hypothetical protein